MKNRATIIVLEGQDATGKSVQSACLVDELRKLGFSVTCVKSPFADHVCCRLIYDMLLDGRARRFPNFFQFAHFVNKLTFQFFTLRNLLKRNDFVVFDRWTASMLVYGLADGASSWFTKSLLWFLRRPDVTVLLDGIKFFRDGSEDSYEADAALQKDVRGRYISWALEHDDVGIVSSTQDVYHVTQDIVGVLASRGVLRQGKVKDG